jgi:lipopolysaccharide/colanic/teichoic acid biosynthesis glycosyltransferase
MLKRSCDVALAILGLVLLSPLFLLLAIVVKLESAGPVFFRQTRVGKDFRTFTLLKFRTMRVATEEECAAGYGANGRMQFFESTRITGVGAILRRTKLDEIPQLWNVLRGEMSLVGPRPLVEWQVEMIREHYARILSVRPGLTDLASIRFRGEEDLLGTVEDPVDYYFRIIMPEKMELQHDYLKRRSLMLDLWILWSTVLVCLGTKRTRRWIEVSVARKMYRRHAAFSPARSIETPDGELSSVGD